jgi:hypothetical protein
MVETRSLLKKKRVGLLSQTDGQRAAFGQTALVTILWRTHGRSGKHSLSSRCRYNPRVDQLESVRL